jgi:hypothetical protein
MENMVFGPNQINHPEINTSPRFVKPLFEKNEDVAKLHQVYYARTV